MIARIITFQGAQYGLLAAQPNWDTEVKVTLELPTDVSKEPITLQESRRTFAQSARYKMSWTTYLSNSADSTELRLFLTRIRGEGIFVPLWPDACEMELPLTSPNQTVINLVDLPVRFGIYWIIANDTFSKWEIVTVASLNQSTRIMRLSIGAKYAWASGTRMYPLLLGKLDEDRPKAEAITDETLEVELAIKENSQFSARVSPASVTLPLVGPHIAAFATTRKWDVAPNFSRPVDWTEMPDIVYEQVGFLRQEQQRVYDHRTPRGLELEFYQAERKSAAKIEYFWRASRANVLRFMIPTYRGDLRLAEDTPVAGFPTWIKCERNVFSDPARAWQPGDPFIAIIGSNDSVDPYRLTTVIDVPDKNVSRLVASTNVAVHNADTAIVSHLLLARFAEATLEWTYTTPYLATTRLKFVELPHEYGPVIPAALPEPAYLFIFNEVGIRTDRFTSYENTIQIPGGAYQGTYIPAPFSFDTVKVGLKLDQEKLDLKSFKFPGNPLNKMWPFALDGILTVEIVEVDAVTPRSITAVTRFFGDVWSVDSEYKATAVPFGNLFDRKFPRFLLSVSDNYTQFSPPTMLAASAFVVADGKINDPKIATGDHTSQTLIVNSPIGHAKEQYYFAGGWLETGTGAALEKRGILNSAPVTPPSEPGFTVYNRTLTVDHTKVPSTQTNFPVLVNVTDATLKTAANGGHVLRSDGFDIGFYSDSTGTTKLKWEMERYNPATGEVVAWVKIASLSSSVDTTFYMGYGDSAITTDQSDAINTWSNSFLGVYHLKDGTTLNVNSATGSNNGTNHSATATTGQIDGGASFASASSQYIDCGTGINPLEITLSAWVKGTSFPNAYNSTVTRVNTTPATSYSGMYVKSNGKLACFCFRASGGADVSFDGTGPTTMAAGTWYYLTLVYRQDTTANGGGLKGYINATQEGSVSVNLIALTITASPTFIGNDNGTAGRFWNGVIDEARIASTARSADWITTEYNNQNAPSTFISLSAETTIPLVPDPGSVTLTIDRPLLKARNLQPISLYPGYDGSIDQCETRFQNRINYGGHAYIPNVNPGVKAMKPAETAGGKKGAG